MRHKLTMILIATLITVFTVSEARAGQATFSDAWKQDAAGNWYVEQTGKGKVTNAWLCDDAVASNGKDVWYLLDANGNMVTAGLVQDGTGNFYSLETEHNGYFGMLRYKSGNYEGIDLSLEGSHNGAFAAVLNADGIEALKAKYGVTSVAGINNANCVYTSTFNTSSAVISTGNAVSAAASSDTAYKTSLITTELSTKVYQGIEFSTENLGMSSMALSCILNPVNNTATAKKILTEKQYYDTGTDRLHASAAQISEARAFAESWARANTTSGMTDKEKHELIYDYMRSTIKYSEDATNHQTSYGALIDRTCVCGGYANGYMVMADACGITAKYVTHIDHAFNLAYLDGEWYAIDVTKGYKYNAPTTAVYYMRDTPASDDSIDEKVEKINERNANRSETQAKTNSRKLAGAEEAYDAGAVFHIDDDNLVERMVDSAMDRSDKQKYVTQHEYCVLYFDDISEFKDVNQKITNYPGGKLTTQCENLMTDNYNLRAPNKITGAKYSGVSIDYEQYMENGISKVRPWIDENGSTYVIVRFTIDYERP